ncbi:MAG: cadmium-translocating P-type ATPase [Bacteroidetes bacterium]|nr:cadmium-translocating P-type ATPase [Bacteroidota bacterium]
METINWKVEGMTCSNCALTINKYLEKKGMQHVKVSFAGGDVSFETKEDSATQELKKGIEDLGYKVVDDSVANTKTARPLNKFLRYLLICLPFTLILMLHMFNGWLHWHWLMNPWLQLTLCLPVYIVGMSFFGKSAIKSIGNGMPNMNVLISIGATAAFLYSLVGTLLNLGEGYLFYETAAAIITLVFLGNWLEDISVQSTQRSLNKLARAQKIMANMIAFDDQHQEIIFPVENTQLRNGDLVLIKSGEQVPADCKILWGDASANESIITGESIPVAKKAKDALIGGSVLIDGTVKAQVTATANDSVLSGIINLVKRAQGDKPPIQQLADKISAIFVPVVLAIALVCFVSNYIFLHDLTAAIMRSIAVLVIACPCAMGLATPAAIAVGLGRAATNGILFRNTKSLELFKNIRQVVFDKTGTLTTGEFAIADFFHQSTITREEFMQIAFSLEKYSNHPIAKCIANAWKTKNDLRWTKVDEIKGLGINATASNGDIYRAGSYRIAEQLTKEESHNVYIVKNNELLGWIDVKDSVRTEATDVIRYLQSKKIKTILLSGDRFSNCKKIADELGIDEVIAEQTPEQKLEKIAALTAQMPTVMVGDGINDAPALAKATIGISMSDASHIAIQTADVVLMNKGLKNLPVSLNLGRNVFLTIQQNLFWAFFYNVIAIPVAAFGLLTPAVGALVMALSDVVLVINSLRLYVKKVG